MRSLIADSEHSSPDSDRPLAERLDSLLREMSREEMIAQLVGVDVERLMTDQQLDPEKLAAQLSEGCAAFTGLAGHVGADQNTYRRIAGQLKEFLASHQGFPAWICESPESLEPLLGPELIVHRLELAASFAPGLVADFASRYRCVCLDLGVDALLAPSLAIAAHPERFSAGADAYLAGRIAVAYLRGLQGDATDDPVLACAGDFVAQSLAAEESAGADNSRVRVGRRELREVFAEPYAAAIREAGLAAISLADLTIDGVPVTGASEVLDDLLRDALGYRGLVISVAGGIRNLVDQHRVAENLEDAAVAALSAGVDIDLDGSSFRAELPAALADGSVSGELLNRAVRRVLRSKLQCGLFDRAAALQADSPAEPAALTPPFEASAAALHEAGIVLLRNSGGALPLAATARLRVMDLSGGALIAALQAQGCNVTLLDLDNPGTPLPESEEADAAIVCIAGDISSGSGEAEAVLLRKLESLAQQLPTVVIVDTDSLQLATRLSDRIQAILVAWEFSLGSIRAAAGVLCDAVNPSGRLPLELPAGPDPLAQAPGYCFGHGLSYSHFEYRALTCADTVDTHSAVEVAVEVINESSRNGVEIVQLYGHDPVAETTRPERQLIGFHRLALAAGQSKRVVFQLDVSQFAYYNRRLEYVVDPGVIVLLAGASSRDIRARARLNLQGDVRVFKQQQRLATQSREVELSP